MILAMEMKIDKKSKTIGLEFEIRDIVLMTFAANFYTEIAFKQQHVCRFIIASAMEDIIKQVKLVISKYMFNGSEINLYKTLYIQNKYTEKIGFDLRFGLWTLLYSALSSYQKFDTLSNAFEKWTRLKKIGKFKTLKCIHTERLIRTLHDTFYDFDLDTILK
jgi:hypothetical protein